MDFIWTSTCRPTCRLGHRYAGRQFPLTPKNQAGASGLREYRAPLPLGTSLVEGEFLSVSLVLYSGDGVLLPNDVLLTTEGQTSVLVYENGKARKIPVTFRAGGAKGSWCGRTWPGRRCFWPSRISCCGPPRECRSKSSASATSDRGDDHVRFFS